MSSLNQVTLVCRLTRDPEFKIFPNGGGVASFGIAFTGKRSKNQQTGNWEDQPCFLDCKAFDPGEDKPRRLGKIVMDYIKKGNQVCIVGHLIQEEWNDQQTGQKRRIHKLEVDNIVLLAGQNQQQSKTQNSNDAPDDGGGYDANNDPDGIPF